MSSFASVDSEEVRDLETLGSADAPTKCGRLQGVAPRRGTGNSVSRSAFSISVAANSVSHSSQRANLTVSFHSGTYPDISFRRMKRTDSYSL
jgi:hypothetical protein